MWIFDYIGCQSAANAAQRSGGSMDGQDFVSPVR